MPSPSVYKGLTILEGASGAAGQALTDNFKTLADEVEAAADPAGADAQVQYNDAGALAGAPGLTYTKVSQNVAVGGDFSVIAAKKIILDGAGGNDYIIYQNARFEFFLAGVLAAVIETV